MRRGTLPPWSAHTSLDTLDLSANSITGSLPPDYANFPQLTTLLLSDNQLHGCAHVMAVFLVRCVCVARATCACVLSVVGHTRCTPEQGVCRINFMWHGFSALLFPACGVSHICAHDSFTLSYCSNSYRF